VKTSSAKNKGRLLQNWVRDTICRVFPLELDDVRSTSMGKGGEDIQLSPQARKLLPLSIECKSVARFAGYKYLDQAVSNSKGYQPIAVVKANRRSPIVLIDAEYFFSLLTKN